MKGYQTLVLVPTTSLRFLDLPIEVRDMIYEFILADETTKLKLSKPKHEASKVVGIEYAPRTNAWKESRKFNEKFKKYIDWYRRTPLSLILANKQVHNEAIKVLYRSRSFSFACEATLSRFFELNEGCAQHLTHIVLTESSTSAQSMDLIAKARPRSLQQLELTHTSSLFLRISDLSKNIPATLLRLSTPLLDAVYLARQRKGINVGIDQLLMIDHGECKGSGRRSTCRELEEQLTKLIKEEYPMI